MKRLFSVLLTTLFLASSVFASVGGPWSGNILGNNSNANQVNPLNPSGLYQGTIKGQNLAGVITFVSGTTGGQVVVSSSTFRGVVIVTNTSTGSVVTTPIYSYSQTTVSTTGYGSFFFEGKQGAANLNTVVDLGGRRVSGIIEGAGSRTVPLSLTRPATSTNPLTVYSVSDSVYLNGTFDAKLSSNWTSNNFKGSGILTVTKLDAAGAQADLNNHPATSSGDYVLRTYTVTVPVVFKVTGVQTSNVLPNSFTPPTLAPTLPAITGTTTL